MVQLLLPKQSVRVRFPLPAPPSSQCFRAFQGIPPNQEASESLIAVPRFKLPSPLLESPKFGAPSAPSRTQIDRPSPSLGHPINPKNLISVPSLDRQPAHHRASQNGAPEFRSGLTRQSVAQGDLSEDDPEFPKGSEQNGQPSPSKISSTSRWLQTTTSIHSNVQSFPHLPIALLNIITIALLATITLTLAITLHEAGINQVLDTQFKTTVNQRRHRTIGQ